MTKDYSALFMTQETFDKILQTIRVNKKPSPYCQAFTIYLTDYPKIACTLYNAGDINIGKVLNLAKKIGEEL